MKWMGWGPADLGYPAAYPEHIEAIIELMEQTARRQDRPQDDDDFFGGAGS